MKLKKLLYKIFITDAGWLIIPLIVSPLALAEYLYFGIWETYWLTSTMNVAAQSHATALALAPADRTPQNFLSRTPRDFGFSLSPPLRLDSHIFKPTTTLALDGISDKEMRLSIHNVNARQCFLISLSLIDSDIADGGNSLHLNGVTHAGVSIDNGPIIPQTTKSEDERVGLGDRLNQLVKTLDAQCNAPMPHETTERVIHIVIDLTRKDVGIPRA